MLSPSQALAITGSPASDTSRTYLSLEVVGKGRAAGDRQLGSESTFASTVRATGEVGDSEKRIDRSRISRRDEVGLSKHR